MQHIVFGSSQATLDSGVLESQVYTAHARGMAKGNLAEPLERFVASVEACLIALGERVDASNGGVLELDLVDWVTTAMFESETPALFGPSLFDAGHSTLSPAELRAAFNDFDAAFPLLASGLIPSFLQGFIPPIAKGLEGRRKLIEHLGTWAKADMPGLEKGVVRDMVEIGVKAGLGDEESGIFALGTFW